MRDGVNIWSGACGDELAAALTNPTELARRKGNLARSYPVRMGDRVYEDAEAAYHALKPASRSVETVAQVVCAKLHQHPQLASWILARGGREWLVRCRHATGARSARFQWWEGEGLASPFVAALVDGYDRFRAQGAAPTPAASSAPTPLE